MASTVKPASTAVTLKEQRAKLREELSAFAPSFAKVLPKTVTPDALITLALVAANYNPKLFDCTPESVALSLMKIAQWNLDIGRTAHLVPFGRVCTPIRDWKGDAEMLYRAGFVRDIQAHVVYRGEQFRVEYGTASELYHTPDFPPGADTDITHAYAVALLRGGIKTFEVMSIEEVSEIRQNSPMPNSPAWKGHYSEMVKKTLIHRLAKRLPMSSGTGRNPLDDAEGIDAVAFDTVPQLARPIVDNRVRTVTSKEYGGQENEGDIRMAPGRSTEAPDLTGEDESLEEDRQLAESEGELPLTGGRQTPASKLGVRVPKPGAVQDAIRANHDAIRQGH